MLCEAVAEFPHASTAVQVRTITCDPAHCPGVVLSCEVNVTDPPHASTAVAVANEGVSVHETVDGDGNCEITGAVVSCTCTVCTAVEEFPQTSVAVHVLVTE